MVNRMRATRGHTNNRRSHHRVANPALSKDEKGTIHVRHRASPITGAYKGKQVIDVDKKAMKKQSKAVKKTEDK